MLNKQKEVLSRADTVDQNFTLCSLPAFKGEMLLHGELMQKRTSSLCSQKGVKDPQSIPGSVVVPEFCKMLFWGNRVESLWDPSLFVTSTREATIISQ